MSASENNETLTPKQEHCIIALCNEPTLQKAAASVDVCEKTVRRWMKIPEFKSAYREARRESFSHAISLAQRYASLAVNTLAKVMADTTAPQHAKVSASVALLRFGRESIELDDLTGRIEALELSAAETNKK